jgi:hypothetical protein
VAADEVNNNVLAASYAVALAVAGVNDFDVDRLVKTSHGAGAGDGTP